MKLMQKPAHEPTSPLEKGGLRGIPATAALANQLESPLPPFSKGGNSLDAPLSHPSPPTMTNALETQ
jgi:hypothetical protein